MARKKTIETPAAPTTLSAVPKPRAPRVARPKRAILARTVSDAPSYEEIAEAAYLRFIDRGARHGSDFDDWVEAERDLSARRGYAKAG